MKFTIKEFLDRLPLPPTEKWENGIWDLEPFQKDGVKLLFFAPSGVDYQTAHDDNEFYFIARGTGELVIEDDRSSFSVGDVFFVEAGKAHHFEKFSQDFSTWAIFF